MHPIELKYSSQNMWLKNEGNRSMRLGITYHYQQQLKNIVFIELPAAGSQIISGEPFGTIESSKTSSDLISPVSGKVLEVNLSILDKPGLINKEPYGQGWLLLVQPDKPQELHSLLSSKEYITLTETQA